MEQKKETSDNKKFYDKEKRLSFISRLLRWLILGSLLLFIISSSILHTLGYAAPSIHGLCPYGGLASSLSIIMYGTFFKKILIGTFIIFISTMLLAIVFRRSFCGQLCAFGALQEFFGNLGRKIFKGRKFVVPTKIDRIFRYLKYLVLIFTVAMSWMTGILWITPYCPYNALGHMADFQSLISVYLIGFILLIITLVGSFLCERFFCKYLCPAGAFYAIIGKISPFAVRINKEKCIDCGLCNEICPVNVNIMDAKKEKITDPECINCNECVNACPKEGALNAGFSKKTVLHPILATILVLSLFFTPVIAATATDTFQILPNKFERGSKSHENEKGNCLNCNDQKELDSVHMKDIKGSMTMSEISSLLDLPLKKLYIKIGLPENYPENNTIRQAADSTGSTVSDLKNKIFE